MDTRASLRLATAAFLCGFGLPGCAADDSTSSGDSADTSVPGGKADDTSRTPDIAISADSCTVADEPDSWFLADPPLEATLHALTWLREEYPRVEDSPGSYQPKLEKVISLESADRLVFQMIDVKPPYYYQGQGNYEKTRSWVVFVDGDTYRTYERRIAFPIGDSYLLYSPKPDGPYNDSETSYTLVDKNGEVIQEETWLSISSTRVANDAVVVSANRNYSYATYRMYVVRPEGIFELRGDHNLTQVAPVCDGFESSSRARR